MATADNDGKTSGLSAEERQAVKDRARELRLSKKRLSKQEREAIEANDVLEAIAKMSNSDQAICQAVSRIVTEVAPDLKTRLWYGMPAFTRNGKVLMHVLPAGKFHMRYATLGFEDSAGLDDGASWPVAYAITDIDSHTESLIRRTIANAVRELPLDEESPER
ncbi:MAG: DUF1801 domain-containing protein [Bifidobacterium crudilactis]|jgi:uncharacterized protein YdhG (YjbR/CyaY superfamily)|nr:DUF1801 domain-containing protein [Bifidobacterium crudilactis]